MALVLKDRVQEAATPNTTVSFTCAGAIAGFQAFSVIGNGNTTFYTGVDGSGNWESGIGTYTTAGNLVTRTTILSSSNGGSAVTFSGSVSLFVDYPATKSINLDASGNASPLGTIASGTWQGSTVGVAYGGTGVTASSGANSVVLRDADQNAAINRINQSNAVTTSAAGTTTLTAASSFSQTLVGTAVQTYKLPDATTLATGVAFEFNNNSTSLLTIQDYALATIATVSAGGAASLVVLTNATVAGTWDTHGYIPENVTWGTNALVLGGTVITGGTWNGGTIDSGYGGTGLTTFTAANNALYSTSAGALAAGTLPVLAGGTGVTTSTGTGNNVLSTSPTLVTPILGTPSSGTLTNCTFPTLNQNTTGYAAALSGGSAGTVPYQSSVNTTAMLAAGTSGQVLTSAGNAAPTWTTPTTGTVTGVTGTAPVVSSGGTAPAISMSAASSAVNGYMTGVYATKLDGIATGATANTGTVTSVATSGNVSGITLTGGTITGSGTITLGGAIGTLNQNTTGSSGSCTGNAATATQLSTASGSAPSYACRAWVNFNGTGTVAIRASGNVSSITDNALGNYTVNFTTAMPDANYSWPSSMNYQNTLPQGLLTGTSTSVKTASALEIFTVNSTTNGRVDTTDVTIAIFR